MKVTVQWNQSKMHLGFDQLVKRADARSRSELDEAPGKCTERVFRAHGARRREGARTAFVGPLQPQRRRFSYIERVSVRKKVV